MSNLIKVRVQPTAAVGGGGGGGGGGGLGPVSAQNPV